MTFVCHCCCTSHRLWPLTVPHPPPAALTTSVCQGLATLPGVSRGVNIPASGRPSPQQIESSCSTEQPAYFQFLLFPSSIPSPALFGVTSQTNILIPGSASGGNQLGWPGRMGEIWTDGGSWLGRAGGQCGREDSRGDCTVNTEHRRETASSVWLEQPFSNLFDCDSW